MTSPAGWDHPDTARAYEEFCRRYARYRNASRVLAAHAHVSPAHAVLDFAAGTGRTADAVLPMLGTAGTVLCVEPAGAMRAVGMARIHDPRLSWAAELPGEASRWDRILCSAAIWQVTSLQDLFCRFSRMLKRAGALCFNIPSLYLGEADKPGGGEDPLLLRLGALLAERRTVPPPPPGRPLPTATEIDSMLRAAHLRPERWTRRCRLFHRAYRDWLKIPVNTDAMFAGLSADARAAIIDQAFGEVDQRSWRWESWSGWTAWKSEKEE